MILGQVKAGSAFRFFCDRFDECCAWPSPLWIVRWSTGLGRPTVRPV